MGLQISETTTDLTLTNGKFDSISGIAALGQRVKDRLFTFRDEWFLDKNFGVPYLGKILGESPRNLAAVASILKAEIRKSAADDATLTSFQLTHDTITRELKAAFLLVDASGEVTEQSLIL